MSDGSSYVLLQNNFCRLLIKWKQQGTWKYTIWVKVKQDQNHQKSVCVSMHVCTHTRWLCKYVHKYPDTDLKRLITSRWGNGEPRSREKISFPITFFFTICIFYYMSMLFFKKKIDVGQTINLEKNVFSWAFYAIHICLKISEIKQWLFLFFSLKKWHCFLRLSPYSY